MTNTPWTFGQARSASNDAEIQQQQAEELLAAANAAYAAAEEAYRKALALEMWNLRRQGVAWSTLGDLARGAERVAALKRERDEKEGDMLVARQAVFRRSADRKDVEAFVQWSMRRDLAEGRA